MAEYSSTVTLGGETLYIRSATPKKEQKTRKSVLGKTLTETRIISKDAQQWRISISGIITTDISTNRAVLDALDNVTTHAFVDGIHDGTYYIVPGSLQFDDSEEDVGLSYKYSLTLVEE